MGKGIHVHIHILIINVSCAQIVRTHIRCPVLPPVFPLSHLQAATNGTTASLLTGDTAKAIMKHGSVFESHATWMRFLGFLLEALLHGHALIVHERLCNDLPPGPASLTTAALVCFTEICM